MIKLISLCVYIYIYLYIGTYIHETRFEKLFCKTPDSKLLLVLQSVFNSAHHCSMKAAIGNLSGYG